MDLAADSSFMRVEFMAMSYFSSCRIESSKIPLCTSSSSNAGYYKDIKGGNSCGAAVVC